MDVLRSLLFIISVGAISSVSLAQMEMSYSVREKMDYSTIINQLDLSDMRQAMRDIWRQGLNPRDYWTDRLETLYSGGNNRVRPLANEAYLRMLQNLYLGTMDPQEAGRDVKLVRKDFLTAKQLQVLSVTSGRNAINLIDLVAPQNPPYLAVKDGLNRIYPSCQDGTWTDIAPVNIPLRLYTHHIVIPEIKKRLIVLGYKIDNMNDLYDGDVQNAVVDIQWNLRIQPDGQITPKGKVWSFLNVPCIERVHQLQYDMEKMRWFPQFFDNRYIFVNLAMSYFILSDQTYQTPRVMTFRTVNGRPARKSPTMVDQVVKVIVNPFWIVPPTIFSEDKVRNLQNLNADQITQYFNLHHYEVWDADFRRKIDPTTIDWPGLAAGRVPPDIHIRQLPHLGNALGVLKFDLTNPYTIYMHDTNQRELFNVPMRQLSSGCMRLEKPLDLAEYLLEDTPWNRETIESLMARPGEVLSKSTELPIPKNKITSVYAAYLTSLMSSDGVVHFVEDIYGQNAAIKDRMGGLL